jgi:AraC family transcriptional regulator
VGLAVELPEDATDCRYRPWVLDVERRVNPQIGLDLPASLNPSPQQALTGLSNALLSGTSRSFCAPDLLGALSIKAVLAGSVIWEAGGHRYVVRENTYLVVNRGQAYSFTIDSATPSTTLSVFFQHGFVEEVHRGLTQPDAALLDAPDAARPGSLLFRQCLEPEPSGVLAALRALHAARSRGKTSRSAGEEAFLRIAQALVRESPRTAEAASRLSSVRASTRAELMRRVLRGRDFLLSRMDESVSIADAARAAGISRYHFFRAFRAAFQVTPHQFLTTQRLARARALLRSGKHTVTEVCLESGFQSVGSFSSLFRRHFGVSPQQELRSAP